MTTTTKATKAIKTTPETFEAPEGFNEALLKVQVNAVAAWVAANPTATITAVAVAVGEGGLPAYLRRDNGKRADINRMMVEGGSVKALLPKAAKLGGGWTDIVAGLTGGYSRSAAGDGTPAFKLVA